MSPRDSTIFTMICVYNRVEYARWESEQWASWAHCRTKHTVNLWFINLLQKTTGTYKINCLQWLRVAEAALLPSTMFSLRLVYSLRSYLIGTGEWIIPKNKERRIIPVPLRHMFCSSQIQSIGNVTDDALYGRAVNGVSLKCYSWCFEPGLQTESHKKWCMHNCFSFSMFGVLNHFFCCSFYHVWLTMSAFAPAICLHYGLFQLFNILIYRFISMTSLNAINCISLIHWET